MGGCCVSEYCLLTYKHVAGSLCKASYPALPARKTLRDNGSIAPYPTNQISTIQTGLVDRLRQQSASIKRQLQASLLRPQLRINLYISNGRVWGCSLHKVGAQVSCGDQALQDAV